MLFCMINGGGLVVSWWRVGWCVFGSTNRVVVGMVGFGGNFFINKQKSDISIKTGDNPPSRHQTVQQKKSQYAPGMYSFLVAGISIAEPSRQSRATPLTRCRAPLIAGFLFCWNPPARRGWNHSLETVFISFRIPDCLRSAENISFP